jgi:hypothetical protein
MEARNPASGPGRPMLRTVVRAGEAGVAPADLKPKMRVRGLNFFYGAYQALRDIAPLELAGYALGTTYDPSFIEETGAQGNQGETSTGTGVVRASAGARFASRTRKASGTGTG